MHSAAAPPSTGRSSPPPDRPLSADPPAEWVVNGRRLDDPGNWRLTSCEREMG